MLEAVLRHVRVEDVYRRQVPLVRGICKRLRVASPPVGRCLLSRAVVGPAWQVRQQWRVDRTPLQAREARAARHGRVEVREGGAIAREEVIERLEVLDQLLLAVLTEGAPSGRVDGPKVGP